MTQSLDTAVPSGAERSPEPAAPTTTQSESPSPAALLALARELAAEPGLTDRLAAAEDERSWLALPAPPGTSAWLIAWPAGTGTGWHDHGDAVGAFVTVAGRLTERAAEIPAAHEFGAPVALGADGGEGGEGGRAESGVRTRILAAGASRVFGSRHIHEVTNGQAQTAYSVHVYAPELTLMRRYVPSGGYLLPVGVEVAEEW